MSAERQRRYRQRRKAGERLLRVPVDDLIIEKLVEHNWLFPGNETNLEQVATAVAQVIDCWALGTLAPATTNGAPTPLRVTPTRQPNLETEGAGYRIKAPESKDKVCS